MWKPVRPTISAHQVVSLSEIEKLSIPKDGEMFNHVHVALRTQLADSLIDAKVQSRYFNMYGDGLHNTHVEYSINLIVLTPQELQQLIEEEARKYRG